MLKKAQFQQFLLWIFLVYSTQHLIRDVLSDVLNIHNSFTEFGHYPGSQAVWCQGFCQWTTLPVEIFYIIASIYLLKNKKFGWLGWLLIILLIPIFLQYSDILIK